MLDLFTPIKETWLFRVNPSVKFIIFFTLFLIIFFNQNFYFTLIQMIFYFFFLFIFSGYSIKKLLLFSIPIALSVFSTVLTMILFGRGETIWWQWLIIKISEESFYYGLLLGFKTACLGFLSLTFLLTSRPMLLFYSLMQQLKFPAKYAYSFIAAIRLVPIIVEEWQIRTNALKIRGVTYSSGFKGVFERLRLYSVPLFAQSIRRAQRIAVAMESKQFQMNASRTYYYITFYTKLDLVFISVMSSLFGLAYFLSTFF